MTVQLLLSLEYSEIRSTLDKGSQLYWGEVAAPEEWVPSWGLESYCTLLASRRQSLEDSLPYLPSVLSHQLGASVTKQ